MQTPWTSDSLSEQQATDPDLLTLREWLEGGFKPAWEDVRGDSPSLKVYWQQFKFLECMKGVIYRRIELVNVPEAVRQLLLPKSLQKEFIALTHGGIAGQLGAAMTKAHVGCGAYWYQ